MPGHRWLYYAGQFTRASGRVVKVRKSLRVPKDSCKLLCVNYWAVLCTVLVQALYDVIYSQFYLVVQP